MLIWEGREGRQGMREGEKPGWLLGSSVCGLLVVLRQSLGVTDVLDGLEDLEDLRQKVFGNGLLQPLGPLADVVGVGGSGHTGGDLLVGAGELEGELRDVDPLIVA